MNPETALSMLFVLQELWESVLRLSSRLRDLVHPAIEILINAERGRRG